MRVKNSIVFAPKIVFNIRKLDFFVRSVKVLEKTKILIPILPMLRAQSGHLLQTLKQMGYKSPSGEVVLKPNDDEILKKPRHPFDEIKCALLYVNLNPN